MNNTFKLSPKDISILESFVSINPSLKFLKGSKQITMSSAKPLYAEAKLSLDIPKDFHLYDVKKFLSVIHLFKEPTVEIKDKTLKITSGSNSTHYKLAAPEMITFPKSEIQSLDSLISFTLTKEMFEQIQKLARIMVQDKIMISNSKGSLALRTIFDPDVHATALNENEDGTTFELGSIDSSFSDFRYIVSLSNLNFIPGDYDIDITSRYIKFINKNVDIFYIIVFESKYSKPL